MDFLDKKNHSKKRGDNNPGSRINWITGGIALFLSLTLGFLFGRKWRLARISAGFTLAMVEKSQEVRALKDLQGLLSKAAEAT